MEENQMNKKRIPGLAMALIIIFGILLYSNVINGAFIWDDHILVKDNVSIRSLSNIPKIFTEDFGEGADVRYDFYRPLHIAVYAIGYSYWGLDTAGYHWMNIVLHILVGFCIYRFVHLLFGSQLWALFTSVLFVVHPVHTEAVSYISNLGELMAALFILLSLIGYIQWLSNNSKFQYVLFLVSFMLALLSKEYGIIVPFLLLVYHCAFHKRIKIVSYLPVLGVIIIYMVIRSVAMESSALKIGADPLARLATFFVAVTNYIRLLFVPTGLHMEYGQPVFSWFSFRVLFGLLLVALLCGLAISKRWRNPLITFSIAWFFVALLPFTNIFTLPFYMAEHYIYMPSLGFFILLGFILSKGCQQPRTRVYTCILALIILGLHSYITYKQTDYWQEPISFYKQSLKYEPNNSRLYHNLGDAYLDSNDYGQAILSYKKAIELEPDIANTYNNLALAYIQFGAIEQATDSYQKAMKIDPAYVDTYNNFGALLFKLGERDQAIGLYQKALQLNPAYRKVYLNLGLAYAQSGDTDKAIEHYKQAIALDPSYAEAYNNLGNIHLSLGEIKEALLLFSKATDINPLYIDAYYNMGFAHNAAGDAYKAVELFSKVISLDSTHADAFYNLGVLYMNSGNNKEAENLFNRVLEIQPQADVYNRLALIYLDRNDIELAIEYHDRATDLGYHNPDLTSALEPYRKKDQ